MLLKVYNYILTILSQQVDNFGIDWGSAEQIYSILQDGSWIMDIKTRDISLAFILFLPDFLLFCSAISLILLFGYHYRRKNQVALFLCLSRFSAFTCGLVGLVFLIQWILMVYNIDFTPNIFDTAFSGIDWNVGYSIFGRSILINIYSQSLKLFVTVVAYFIFTLARVWYLSKDSSHIAPELLILLYISLALGIILLSCTHFIILLLTLESFSLSLYILTTIEKARGGITAAVKYFAFGTFGSILLLWGVVHLYAIFPALVSYSLVNAVHLMVLNSGNLFHHGLTEALDFVALMLFMGFLVKLGAAPSHQWVPDVYTGVPMVITLFFATVVKFIIFIVFFRATMYFNSNLLIDFFIISSLAVGSLLTLRQLEIKRFLAYSSITHVGFLLMGDLVASLVYIITYICASLLLFSVLLTTRLYKKELVYLSDLRAIKKSGYWNLTLLVISLASMAGLPPFAGFFGKFLIWNSLLEDIYLYNSITNYFLLGFSVFITLIIIFYYIRLLAYIFVSNDKEMSLYTLNFGYDSVYLPQLFLLTSIGAWTIIQPFFINITLSICNGAFIN